MTWGALQEATTATAAAVVSTLPHSFVARSQNDVAALTGPVVTDAVVAPETGREVSPTTPSNH